MSEQSKGSICAKLFKLGADEWSNYRGTHELSEIAPIDSRKAHMAAFVEIAASDNGTGGRRDPNSTRPEGASGNSATKNKFLQVFQGDVIVATFTGGFRDTWRRSKENP